MEKFGRIMVFRAGLPEFIAQPSWLKFAGTFSMDYETLKMWVDGYCAAKNEGHTRAVYTWEAYYPERDYGKCVGIYEV